MRNIKKIFNITVSVKEGASRNILRGIVQNDTLNEVNVRLTDGAKAFDYTGYKSIVFKVLKADGTTYIDSESSRVIATSPTDGVITIVLSGQATTAAGLCQSVIEVYSAAGKMTTARFNYEVFGALEVDENAVMSEPEYPAIQELYTELSGLKAVIEPAAVAEPIRVANEAQRVAAETQRVINESTRTTNELDRNRAEEERQAAEVQRIAAYEANNLFVTWDADTSFVKGNRVTHGGSTYVCLKDNHGINPASDTEQAYWLLVAKRGDRGADGEQGVSGVVVTTDAQYGFEYDAVTGHLILVYNDEDEPPNFEYDEATGHLYYNFE